jgi:hypothetical protein
MFGFCSFLNSVDYPKPIVKHEEVSKENMSKMKLAYDAHKAAGGADVGYDGGCFLCLFVDCELWFAWESDVLSILAQEIRALYERKGGYIRNHLALGLN